MMVMLTWRHGRVRLQNSIFFKLKFALVPDKTTFCEWTKTHAGADSVYFHFDYCATCCGATCWDFLHRNLQAS